MNRLKLQADKSRHTARTCLAARPRRSALLPGRADQTRILHGGSETFTTFTAARFDGAETLKASRPTSPPASPSPLDKRCSTRLDSAILVLRSLGTSSTMRRGRLPTSGGRLSSTATSAPLPQRHVGFWRVFDTEQADLAHLPTERAPAGGGGTKLSGSRSRQSPRQEGQPQGPGEWAVEDCRSWLPPRVAARRRGRNRLRLDKGRQRRRSATCESPRRR